MKDFRDKVAAITGAGSGIGRALAVELAARGCHLALSDIDPAGLAETERLLKTSPVTVTTDVVDVADRVAVFEWADRVVERHGAVHLVINNAGVAAAGTVEETPLEDYEWLMGINFWGVVYGTKAFLPHLRAAGEGHIVNISSIFGLMAVPTLSAYHASKYAVRGFTESLREELDLDGGRVSATSVHPGGINTNIARAARMNESAGRLIGGRTSEVQADFQRLLRTSPEATAKAILRGVRRNARRVVVGVDAYAGDALVRTLPTVYQRLVGLAAKRV